MYAPPAFTRPEPFAIPPANAHKAGLASGSGRIIADIASETQARSNWCWAAVGMTLSRFLGTARTQADVATLWYSPSPPGNDVQSLWAVVQKVFGVSLEKLRSDDLKDIEAARVRIATSIDAGRPVAVNLLWDAGGGHFVCIFGYDRLADSHAFWIFDPTGLDSNSSNRELRLLSEMTRYPEPTGTAGRFGRWAEALLIPASAG